MGKRYNKEKVAEWARTHRESKRAAYRRWERAHPEKARLKSRVRVCSRKGITLEAYADLLVRQNGRCAICRTADPGRRSWCIDHDHLTRLVRGLLCWKCNLAIGWYEKQLQSRLDIVRSYLDGQPTRLMAVK